MCQYIMFCINKGYPARKTAKHPYAIDSKKQRQYHHNKRFHTFRFPAKQIAVPEKVYRKQYDRKNNRVQLPRLLPPARQGTYRCPADTASRTRKTAENDERTKRMENQIHGHCINPDRNCRCAIFLYICHNSSKNRLNIASHSFCPLLQLILKPYYGSHPCSFSSQFHPETNSHFITPASNNDTQCSSNRCIG